MRAAIARAKAQLAADGLPPTATHRLDHRQMALHWWLARACGRDVSAVPNWRAALLHVYWVGYWALYKAEAALRALKARTGRRRKEL
jgi:hypothetical protein